MRWRQAQINIARTITAVLGLSLSSAVLGLSSSSAAYGWEPAKARSTFPDRKIIQSLNLQNSDLTIAQIGSADIGDDRTSGELAEGVNREGKTEEKVGEKSDASANSGAPEKDVDSAGAKKSSEDKPEDTPISDSSKVWDVETTRTYNTQVLNKVDKIVRKHLYSKALVQSAWIPAIEKNRASILSSKNLMQLFNSINAALAELKSSHCEFATRNDEIFYFLHDLFGRWNRKIAVDGVSVGFITGPPRFAVDQVRYVLDDSPASKAGLHVGDHILSVNGKPYVGVSNFFGTAGKKVTIEYSRGDTKVKTEIVPTKKDEYLEYVRAIGKSARTYEVAGHKIGYVHDWCGGNDAHDALVGVLGSKLADTEGLILDLRDGYGGNGLEDLDFFYRNPAGYPTFCLTNRDGKPDTSIMFYDKPVVALINDGSRSGKELLAYSLQHSHRAVLVGLNTAGAVLGGRLFPLDKRTALYLAVADGKIGQDRLEAIGVAPDIKVDDDCSEAGKAIQLTKAEEELIKLIQKSPKGWNTSGTSAP